MKAPIRRLAFLALVASGPAAAEKGAHLAISAGEYNTVDQSRAAAELGLQWRGGGHRWVFHPIVGGMVTHQGALNVYAGFTFDLPIGSHLALRPSFAPGLYRQGGGKDLGYPLEFRSGLEIGWRFSGGTRVGAEFYHLSNASLGDRNPGENSLILMVAIPAAKLFGR
jgi:hypothetical protein